MVKFPPLMPSADWMANLLLCVSKGQTKHEAIAFANRQLVTPKEFGRFEISDVKGRPVRLSLAIEGGGRRLRTWSFLEEAMLSEHGDWRKNHLGALEACLGRKPYFIELFALINHIYLDKNINCLRDFNSAIFECIYSFLMQKMNPCNLSVFHERKEISERGCEIAKNINPTFSSLQILTEIGKESLLGFLALKN